MKLLAIVFLSLFTLTNARHELNIKVDQSISNGLRSIRRSMNSVISRESVIDAKNKTRLHARDIFIELLYAIRGADHYEVYSGFAKALDGSRLGYYKDKFDLILFECSSMTYSEISGDLLQIVTSTYTLLMYSANMDRSNDNTFLELVMLINDFLEEVSKVKWKTNSIQKKFLVTTTKKTQLLMKTLTGYISLESILQDREQMIRLKLAKAQY